MHCVVLHACLSKNCCAVSRQDRTADYSAASAADCFRTHKLCVRGTGWYWLQLDLVGSEMLRQTQ